MRWTPRRCRHVAACAALVIPVLGAATGSGPEASRQEQAVPRCRVRGSHAWLASRPSPLDSAQVVAGPGVAMVCYSRPRARGRAVYDSVAPFGKAWRTGANEPTVLELTEHAAVAGVPLPAGRYALLTVPRPTTWVVMFHTFVTPDSAFDDPARVFQTLREVGRGTMLVEAVETPVDTFTIRPVADGDGQAFLLEWGSFRARMPVRFRR